MENTERIYRPDEVQGEILLQSYAMWAEVHRAFEKVPTMDYNRALSILSWHMCLNPENPGSGDSEFASAFKTVMLKLTEVKNDKLSRKSREVGEG